MKKSSVQSMQKMPKASLRLLKEVKMKMRTDQVDPDCLSEILKRSKGAYSIQLARSTRTFEH